MFAKPILLHSREGLAGLIFGDLEARICRRRPSARTEEFLLQAAVLHRGGNE